MSGRKARLGAGFNIGGDQAEADPLLEEAFYSSGHFSTIQDRQDPRCFIVGRTGSGKTAALKRLVELNPDKVIRITPEDLSLPYISDLDVVRNLEALDVDLGIFWKALWRHVFIVEVIKHRYKIDSPDAKATVLQTLRSAIQRNAGKKIALSYLDEFEGKFWAETDERVREITTSFTKKIDAAGDIGFSSGFAKGRVVAGKEVEVTETERRELGHRYQRIVNDTQLARLNKMMDVLDEDVLKAQQDFTYIVIDDLDKDWVDSRLANELIMALFKTVHDFKRVKNLKILVALRTNIFVHLDFGSSSGGQEEKYRSLVLSMTWDREQLTALVNERIKIAGERQRSEPASLRSLLPHQNPKRGNPLDYILDRTLLRPRDFISFVRECLANSEGKNQISWDAIRRAEITYSENRLLALRDEWKPNFPGIEQAFAVFRHSPGRMTRADMQDRLDDCILLLAQEGFAGDEWLLKLGQSVLSGPTGSSWSARYGGLVQLLFDIGFLGISAVSRRIPVFSLEEPNAVRYASQIEKVEFFFVARAYHSALEVQTAD